MTDRFVARLRRRVGMRDVDSRQIFFGTYPLWMGEGYEELLRVLGHPLEGHVESGVETPVVALSCDYSSPTRLGDDVEIESWVGKVGRTSVRVDHRLRSRGRDVAHGSITMVCIDVPDGRPVPVPEWLRAACIDREWLDDA